MSENLLWRRFSRAKTNWLNWRSIYDEAYSYAIPNRNPYFMNAGDGSKQVITGERKNVPVYDITAVISTRRLAARLQKNLTPPDEKWFQLEVGDMVTNPIDRKRLQKFLQTYTDIIFKHISNSNFQTAVSEFYLDLCVGTAFLMVLENDDPDRPLLYKAVSPDMVFPEESVLDEIDTHFRRFDDLTQEDIRRLWPQAEIPNTMMQAFRNDPLKTFCIVEGVVFDQADKNWTITVAEEDSKEVLLEVVSESSPWVSARWEKAPREIGGRGAVIQALPTIRSLNKLADNIMRHVDLASAPPWIATTDGIFNPNDFSIEPNKVIVVNPTAFDEMPFRRLDVTTDLNTSTLEMNDLRQQIKEALYDMPVRPIDSPPQTATEIMIRQQEFLEDIQPAFARLSFEFLPRLIERSMHVLKRKGYLPKDLKIDNKLVRIKYMSPLAQAAGLQEVTTLTQYAGIMQQIFGELSLATMNIENIPQYVGERMNIGADIPKTPGDMEMVKQRVLSMMQPPNVMQQAPQPGEQGQPQEIAQQLQGAPESGT